MEKNKLSLQLIKNSYDAEDAKELVMQLLCDKSTFIKRKIFSLDERYGIHSPFFENRLTELTECKKDLKLFFENMNSDDFEFRINCPIEIEVVKKNSVDQQKATKEENSWT